MTWPLVKTGLRFLLQDSVDFLQVFFCQYTRRCFKPQVINDIGMAGQ
jgi:hypothetical protein